MTSRTSAYSQEMRSSELRVCGEVRNLTRNTTLNSPISTVLDNHHRIDRFLLRGIHNRLTQPLRPARDFAQSMDHHSMPVTPFYFGPVLYFLFQAFRNESARPVLYSLYSQNTSNSSVETIITMKNPRSSTNVTERSIPNPIHPSTVEKSRDGM